MRLAAYAFFQVETHASYVETSRPRRHGVEISKSGMAKTIRPQYLIIRRKCRPTCITWSRVVSVLLDGETLCLKTILKKSPDYSSRVDSIPVRRRTYPDSPSRARV